MKTIREILEECFLTIDKEWNREYLNDAVDQAETEIEEVFSQRITGETNELKRYYKSKLKVLEAEVVNHKVGRIKQAHHDLTKILFLQAELAHFKDDAWRTQVYYDDAIEGLRDEIAELKGRDWERNIL